MRGAVATGDEIERLTRGRIERRGEGGEPRHRDRGRRQPNAGIGVVGGVREQIALAQVAVEALPQLYVALPAGTKADPSLPNYVGNVAPFGADMHHGDFVAAFRIDAQAKKVINANGGNIDVTFVPRGPLDAEGREVPLKLEGKVTFKQVRLIEE